MDEHQALRTIAERLAAEFAGRRTPEGSSGPPPRLVLAAVPDQFPKNVPLPEGAVVIGAICYGGTERHTHLMVDVPQDARQVRAFFLDRLRGAGWTPLEYMPERGGFIPFGSTVYFVEDMDVAEGGTDLRMDVRPAGESSTQVRLTATVFPPGSPGPGVRLARHGVSGIRSPFPGIHLPSDAEVLPGGGSTGSGGRFETALVMRTDMDQAGLAAFITGQLERAGWARVGGGEAGALAWSNWDFADGAGQPYRGTLSMLRHPERAGQYRLILEAEWVPRR
ncbi:MAG TPA: hypothetical protein VFE42_18715 [Chloroflexota bacterium]|nr:hypothetical protein [Chloroflexota bacterium]